jgi:hypothetical protein
MNSYEFVGGLKNYVYEHAAPNAIESLDRPDKDDSADFLRAADWVKSLAPPDRVHLLRAMKLAAEDAIFGMLCVLDGVRVVENSSDKSQFALLAIRNLEIDVITDVRGELLHDIFRGMVDSDEDS